MAKKRMFLGMLAMALAFGLLAAGCATTSAENRGAFSDISVPAKDFTSLGLVSTENVVQNNKGKLFTYNALLQEAKTLGADTIVNVVIDVQREGTKFLGFYLSPKETWYGTATAIKYKDGLLANVTTTKDEKDVITQESTIMSVGGAGGGSSSAALGGKKWYNPFTWFK
jgi:hypothetical protein